MKNILLYIILLGVTLSWTVEKGKLSGVVTYKDINELSYLADAGCEIYVIPEADVRSTQYKDLARVVENFQRIKSDYTLSVYKIIDPDRIKKVQDNFDAVSDFTAKYINGFKQLPAIARASTNESGNYALSLKPGKYYILVVSGNVKSNNIAELQGNIDFKTVDIKPAEATFLNLKFEMQDKLGIKVIRNISMEGC